MVFLFVTTFDLCLSLSLEGGSVGSGETGVVQVCRQTCWYLQWRQQTQTLHSHRSDWIPLAYLSGQISPHVFCATNGYHPL